MTAPTRPDSVSPDPAQSGTAALRPRERDARRRARHQAVSERRNMDIRCWSASPEKRPSRRTNRSAVRSARTHHAGRVHDARACEPACPQSCAHRRWRLLRQTPAVFRIRRKDTSDSAARYGTQDRLRSPHRERLIPCHHQLRHRVLNLRSSGCSVRITLSNVELRPTRDAGPVKPNVRCPGLDVHKEPDRTSAAGHASTSPTTVPCTSVRRYWRPFDLNVSFR